MLLTTKSNLVAKKPRIKQIYSPSIITPFRSLLFLSVMHEPMYYNTLQSTVISSATCVDKKNSFEKVSQSSTYKLSTTVRNRRTHPSLTSSVIVAFETSLEAHSADTPSLDAFASFEC